MLNALRCLGPEQNLVATRLEAEGLKAAAERLCTRACGVCMALLCSYLPCPTASSTSIHTGFTQVAWHQQNAAPMQYHRDRHVTQLHRAEPGPQLCCCASAKQHAGFAKCALARMRLSHR